MNIKDYDSKTFLSAFDKALKDTFKGDTLIDEGMRYAILDGGKRIRPLCVYLGARAVGGDVSCCEVLALALAIECIHNYSLVHDDLPPMDNDDYRRGKLTVHKQFGEANAILIGDQLLSKAMLLLSEGGVAYGEKFSRGAKEISQASMDMVYGQQLDLGGCDSESAYLDMYSKKTGALIVGAMRAGAACAGASGDALKLVGEYAQHIGLAFQLADDLLDIGEDNSIINIIGEERTREMLQEETNLAKRCADAFCDSQLFIGFADRLFRREH